MQGINIAICLDDGWLTEMSFGNCKKLSEAVRQDIRDASLITSEAKCNWQPCQELIWLGLVWNLINGTIAITQRRISNISQTIRNITSQECFVSARELAYFTGKIISTSPVTKNVSQIMTRHCGMFVAAANDWDFKFRLDAYCIQEVRFWENNINKLNSREVNPISNNSYFVVYSDASNSECGAHMALNGKQVCYKQWTEVEANKVRLGGSSPLYSLL